ncbi:amidohydrolase [Eubacteriales bacterium DFI.9.88]|nr:amidohydrolase [Eubacteriales bacterium DFI.9.88]
MERADYILKGAAIFDAVADEPFAGFLAVKGRRIIKVGRGDADEQNFIDSHTQVIDCGGGLIMPGLIDAHMHFFDGIFQNSKYMCRELFACKSARQCVSVIRKFAEEHPDYKTITGMGWFIPSWEDGEPPHKNMLDQICPDRPVYLMCADGHSFWLNSKALEECRVDPNRKLLFGSIEVDETGEPNGLLHEMDACAPCAAAAQALPEGQKRELIVDFIRQLSSHGITSTTDITVLPEPGPVSEELEIVGDLEKEGNLDIRLHLYPSLGTSPDFTTIEEYRQRFHSDKLRVAGLKAFVDGVHGNHTALLLTPYADRPDGAGASFYPFEHYKRQVTAANGCGLGVKLHCTGEGAVRMALDAYEASRQANGPLPVRNSIEHVETLQESDIKRFAKLDVTASMQPVHLMAIGSGLKDKLGEERARYQYAVRSLLEIGANAAFGTDYPVAPFQPLPNVYFAVTRCDEEGQPVEEPIRENITLAQALRAYTYGSAYCLHAEQQLGTLEEGKLADIAVFSENLFQLEPRELLKARICLTMVDGTIVYKQK